MAKAARSLGKALVDYLGTLKITEGPLEGQQFQVMPWQKQVCDAIGAGKLNIPVTMARGNAKSTFTAALACAALDPDGPLFVKRGYIIVVASSLDQARVSFNHIKWFLMEKLEDRSQWRVVDNSHHQQIEHKPTGTMIRGLGSDAGRAHGRAPNFVLADEPAKWQGLDKGKSMHAALRTSRGKQPRMIYMPIGTKPEDPDHWFCKLLESKDDATCAIHYACDPGDEDFSMASIYRANPSYRYLEALRDAIAVEKREAMQGGEDLFNWRALRLNKGTPEVGERERIVSVENWAACVKDRFDRHREGPVFVGIDLGGGTSMSAVAFYWTETGYLETFGAYPAEPSLKERGKHDGVKDRYQRMHERGEVWVYPGKTTNNVLFLEDALKLLDGYHIEQFAADMYKQKDAQHVLGANGWDAEKVVDWRRVGRGPSGMEDVTAFQREVMTGHLKSPDNLAMESAIFESMLVRDTNGNTALDKRRQDGRIDVLQAAVLAVGLGYRYRNPSDGPGPRAFWDRALLDGKKVVEAVG